MYVRRTGDDAETAARERLAEIRAEAARLTGWEPWMTEQRGYAGVPGVFCYWHDRYEQGADCLSKQRKGEPDGTV